MWISCISLAFNSLRLALQTKNLFDLAKEVALGRLMVVMLRYFFSLGIPDAKLLYYESVEFLGTISVGYVLHTNFRG